MGVLDASGTLNVCDRDASGTLHTHAASWFGPWNLGAAYSHYKDNLNINFAPGSCAPPLQGQNSCVPYLPVNTLITQNRTDGYGYGTYTFQGVRIFDTNSSQWLTPDAYAGDVHDPLSQKPFIWNANNPIEWSDPSGFVVEFTITGDSVHIYVPLTFAKGTTRNTSASFMTSLESPYDSNFGNRVMEVYRDV
jgi:hypothetical protein